MTAPSGKSPIVVVGGVYREQCMRPAWREIYGSAGRAATAIAGMGAQVELHSYMDQDSQAVMEARAAFEGFSVKPTSIGKSVSFEYHHGMETPRIYGLKPPLPPLKITAGQIVRFGMMEADAVVEGECVVYDPQNADGPVPFSTNGSKAGQLALILNRHEAALLTGLPNHASVVAMADGLVAAKQAQVVVIKLGPQGALVHDGNTIQAVPAYRTNQVWKIGSGDTFVAHFAFQWLHEGRPPAECADLASRATAYFCETQGFVTPSILASLQLDPIRPSTRFAGGWRPRVYLAGPFFTLAQLWQVQQVRNDLFSMGFDVFSPYHDVGHGSAADVVQVDLEGIARSDIVFAIADGMDPGTVYETGYARAIGKPVVVYCENESQESRKMMEGSDCQIVGDYVSAIYKTVWTACEL